MLKPDEDGPSGWAFEHVSTLNTFDWTIVEEFRFMSFQ